MTRVEFSKMSGAGNDFVFLGPDHSRLKNEASRLARTLCTRRTSVGADGLVIVEDSNGLFMHFYNSDGSEASFCGNGARCMVLFCTAKGLASGEMEFGTASGRHTGEVLDRGVRISMPPARLEKEVSLEAGGASYDVYLIRAGVPHAVILLDSVEGVDLETTGRMLRSHPLFGEEGANADFVAGTGTGEFAIRTYERGVEGETLACGSGCVAAAHLLRQKGLAGDQVAFRVASGDVLSVDIPRGEGRDSHLRGPAAIVFEGWIDLDM
jgi:diaminopimelate epimerase